MHRFYFIFVFTILILNSCRYEPTSVNEVNIEQPGNFYIPIELNPLDSVIKVYYPVEFNYKFSPGKGKVKEVLIKFSGNEVPIYHGLDTINNFTFDPGNFSNGEYELTIRIRVTSGTGSYADKVGAEIYELNYKWKIIISKFDFNFNFACKVVKENNKLKISWDKLDYYGFKGYLVKKNKDFPYDNKDYFSDTIHNVNDIVYYDDSFIGGRSTYIIKAIFSRPGFNDFEKYSKVETYTDFPEISNFEQTGLEYKINWTKCYYTNNFKSYSIIDKYGSSEKELFSTENINDTSKILNFGFFSNRQFILRLKSKKSNKFGEDSVDFGFTLEHSKKFESYNSGYTIHSYNSEPYIYFNKTLKDINAYDFNSKSIIKTISYQNSINYIVSENNKYLIVRDIGYPSEVIIYKPPVFNSFTKINFNDFFNNCYVSSISVSNNGILLLYINDYKTKTKKLVTYDIENKYIKSTNNTNYNIYNLKFSGSGNYAFLINDSLNKLYFYKYIDNNLRLIDSILGVSTLSRAKFLPFEDKLITIYDGLVTTWNCETYTPISSYNTECEFIYDIDKVNNILMASKNNIIYIYDLTNGSLKTKFKCYSDPIIIDKTIIISGAVYKLEF
ncbi:MAG: hypothetical protein HZB41_07405 [Ignavibacteriae bacterium]|nr:hypothetical protein [Ignavibacteriota bacterium]